MINKGPIVRINPHEVHIKDAHFHVTFEITYRGARKDSWIYNVGLPGATGLIVDEKRHGTHRAALAAAIQPKLTNEIRSLIQQRVEQLLDRLDQMQQDSLNVSDAVRSLSRDTMSTIFVGKNEKLLSTPDMGHSILKSYRALFQLAAWHRQFPFLGSLIKIIPHRIIEPIVPHLRFQRVSIPSSLQAYSLTPV